MKEFLVRAKGETYKIKADRMIIDQRQPAIHFIVGIEVVAYVSLQNVEAVVESPYALKN